MGMRVKTMVLAGAVLGVLAATSVTSPVSAAEMPAGSLEKLVGLYLPMQEALAGDSAAVVAGQAAKLATEAEAIAKKEREKPTLDAIEDLEAVVVAARGMKGSEIEALRAQFNPLSRAVGRLVERQAVAGHGIYVWGSTWVSAKTQAECYDYLLRAAVEAHRLGSSHAAAPLEASSHAARGGNQ